MRPTLNNEIVFESTLEARVAAQLLTDAGRADLLEAITPPIDPPRIGRLEFVIKLREEQRGEKDKTEYTCITSKTVELVRTLARAAKPSLPGEPTLSKRKYMSQRLLEVSAKLDDIASQRPARRGVVEVGGVAIFGVTDEEAALLKRREAFVADYLKDNELDRNQLTIEQIIEIRNQSEWKNPPELT